MEELDMNKSFLDKTPVEQTIKEKIESSVQ